MTKVTLKKFENKGKPKIIRFNGKDKLTYSNGDEYVGFFKNGKKDME